MIGTDTDLNGVPVAVAYNGPYYYIVAGDEIYKKSSADGALNGSFAVDSEATDPDDTDSDYSDMCAFNGNIAISRNDVKIALLAGGGETYSETAAFFTDADRPHMLCEYNPSGGKRLYGSEDAKIFSMNTAGTVVNSTTANYSIDLNSYGAVITKLLPASNGIWILTVNTFGGKGHVFLWDGISYQIATDYVLESSGAVAGIIKDDIPYIVDTDGKLMAFSSGSFQEVARLPTDGRYLYNPISTVNDRFMHPNGIMLDDGRINILVDTRYQANGNPMQENCPAGIWEFDPDIGLYHKRSLSLYADVDGEITDYGQQKILRAGCLFKLKSRSSASGDNGTMYAGASLYNGSQVAIDGAIFIDDSNDTVQKYGYFITTDVFTGNILDTWQKVYAQHKKALDSADRIWVKYRFEKEDPTYINLNWATNYRFMTTTDLSACVGQEVEVLSGSGAGGIAHIKTVTGSGTYTVTLDESITGASTATQAASYARVQSWIKAGDPSQLKDFYSEFPIGKPQTHIQLKVCARYTGKGEINGVLIQSDGYKLN